MRRVDLIGKRFGRLVVVAEAPKSTSGQRRVGCVCDCGSTKTQAQWAREVGLGQWVISYRVLADWPIELVLSPQNLRGRRVEVGA